jgi:hypothetical protein
MNPRIHTSSWYHFVDLIAENEKTAADSSPQTFNSLTASQLQFEDFKIVCTSNHWEVLSNFVDGEFQAAWDCFTPSTKVTPAITSLKSVDPFNARQLFDALSISLNTMLRHAVRLPLPFVLA